jgi:DNA-binding NarL/FixJ family response regulator
MTLLIQTTAPLLAQRIEEVLAAHSPAAKVIGTCYTLEAGLEAAKALQPDIVLLDMDMPRVIKEGIRTRLSSAGHRVILLTAKEGRYKQLHRQSVEVVLSEPLDTVKLANLLLDG